MLNLILYFNIIIKENLNATATHPASCQEYLDRGETRNGSYTIKPTLKEHSFKVYCEFSGTKGFTIIKPFGFNDTGKIYPSTTNDSCKNADCFTENISYGINHKQLKVTFLNEHKLYIF